MFELIVRLRQRSIEERRRIAFITALSATLVIALIWGTTLFAGRSRAPLTEVDETTPAEGLWLQIEEGFGALFRSLRGSLKR